MPYTLELNIISRYPVNERQARRVWLDAQVNDFFKQLATVCNSNVPISVGDIPCDVHSICFWIRELLSNTFDEFEMADIAHPDVTLRAGIFEDKLKIEMHDNGRGFPQHVLESDIELCIPTSKSRFKELVGGAGAGLNLVRRSIRFTGNDISLENDNGAKITMSVSLASICKRKCSVVASNNRNIINSTIINIITGSSDDFTLPPVVTTGFFSTELMPKSRFFHPELQREYDDRYKSYDSQKNKLLAITQRRQA